MNYDSIIIGGGLSGLASALLLARSGRRVLVVEQHARPAPAVRGFSHGADYFDTGFHYSGALAEDGPLRVFFRHLGLEQHLELFPFDSEGFDALRFAGTEEDLCLPVGFGNIEACLSARFPAAKERIQAYVREVESSWRRFPYLDLDMDMADLGMRTVYGPSLAERLQEFAAWPELQSLFSMHTMLYGLPPEAVSIHFNALVAGSYYASVHGIVGGGRSLVEAFLTLVSDAGVEIRCCSEVTEITAHSGAVTGIRLNSGEEFQAGEVVVTLNPALVPRLLPPGELRPVYVKRLEGLTQTFSAYVAFIRSRKSLEFLRGRNLFVQPGSGLFAYGDHQPLEERCLYLCGADQGRDQPIHGAVCILPARYEEVAGWRRPDSSRPSEYLAWKQKVTRGLQAILKKNCPEFDEIEIFKVATPLTLCDYFQTVAGGVYGVGHRLGQYNPLPATRLSGLFLSGQAVGAPGLLGALAAAYLTCGFMLGHDTLRSELRTCR